MTELTDPALARFTELFGPEFGHGRSFDPARVSRALAALGDPQEQLYGAVHVAGTNGKGSTIALLRAIAEAAGLDVHAFTKPHLLHLRERFRMHGALASDDVLIATAERVHAAAPDLTQFEAHVAAALLLFAEIPADLALIETGMGGRDDATNVFKHPALTILTPIGLDHQDVLGATLAKIAAHKAGILKPGVPAVIARQMPEAQDVIEAHAARIGAPLLRQGVEWDAFAQAGRLVVQTETRALDLPLPALAGRHQIDNAGLAAVAALTLDDARIDDAAIAQGIAQARWPGRMQPLTRGALAQRARGAELWVDGGHNAHAAHALARALGELQRKRPARTALIIGMRARKDWRAFVETLAPHAALTIAVPIGAEGADPNAIAQAARGAVAGDLPNAIDAALAGGAERILICGSFLLAGEALREAGALD